MFACVCLGSATLAAEAIQTLTARPEVPEGRRSPLCILLPGGAGRMPEATGAMNGLGNLLVQSVTSVDYSMTQGIVMVIVLVFVFTNFFVDILYAWLDPRIRYS